MVGEVEEAGEVAIEVRTAALHLWWQAGGSVCAAPYDMKGCGSRVWW
jgi:hypothetical protein